MIKVHGILAGAVCLIVQGCGMEKDETTAESTVAVAAGTVVPDGGGEVLTESGGAPVDTVAPFAGLWDAGVVQGHLARQGVETSQIGEARNPLLSPRGTRLRSETGEVQVFVYADAGARARDADSLKLEALRTLPGFEQASLVAADNVAIVVVGRDSALRKSVQNVFENRRR